MVSSTSPWPQVLVDPFKLGKKCSCCNEGDVVVDTQLLGNDCIYFKDSVSLYQQPYCIRCKVLFHKSLLTQQEWQEQDLRLKNALGMAENPIAKQRFLDRQKKHHHNNDLRW